MFLMRPISNVLLAMKLVLKLLLSHLRKATLGRNISAVITSSANGLFAVDIADTGVGRTLIQHSSYAQDELERILRLVHPADDVLVVGAHIGALAIPISKHCHRLVAIEANPATFDLLKINLLLNNCANVTAINIAAGRTTEAIRFVLNTCNSGGSKLLPRTRAFKYFYDAPAIIPLQAHSLDEYLAGERFAIILMDIEGSEYHALQG
ncbi:MAG: FkbM family methyltransferase, partial [Betaproteobacteria bacterium]